MKAPQPTVYDIMDIVFDLMWETSGQVVPTPEKYVEVLKEKTGLVPPTPPTQETMAAALAFYCFAEDQVKDVLEKCR